MFSPLKSFFRKAPAPEASAIGRLTYAIGDIHGRDDLFEKMLTRIRNDCEAFDEKPHVVLLGDYVDRGPSSRDVMERIVRLRADSWCDADVLMGNHEEALLRFLREPAYGIVWADYGGGSTLASYGVALPQLRSDAAEWEGVRDAFEAALPASHMTLLHDMRLAVRDGDYLFVHAGVHPDQPLEDQGADTLLWIRGAFLNSEKACDYVVVHGHTPEEEPGNFRWRIGLDTGAYATGVLSAVRLKNDKRHMLSVR